MDIVIEDKAIQQKAIEMIKIIMQQMTEKTDETNIEKILDEYKDKFSELDTEDQTEIEKTIKCVMLMAIISRIKKIGQFFEIDISTSEAIEILKILG